MSSGIAELSLEERIERDGGEEAMDLTVKGDILRDLDPIFVEKHQSFIEEAIANCAEPSYEPPVVWMGPPKLAETVSRS